MIRPLKAFAEARLRQPSLSVETLQKRASQLLPEIGVGAAAREQARELPHQQIRQLAQAQLLTFRIPKKFSGPGATVQQTIQFLIDVASVDSNVAQALRPSFAFVEGLQLLKSVPDRRRWYSRYLAGDVFGNGGWEIGGGNGEVRTRIRKKGGVFQVDGSKYYSTGSLFADWISTVALDGRGKPVGFIVPKDRKGLIIEDDFDAMGQRLTASGTIRLEKMVVHPHELRVRHQSKGKRGPMTPYVQLFLAAVLAGIAKNALQDAITYTRQFARPIKHSSAKVSVEDPYVQLAVGEIAARAYAAESTVLRAAAALDRVWESGLNETIITQASVEVATAQFVVAEATLKAAELVFDCGGASATSRKFNLDRHWRNARTVINHNPRAWKAAVVGAFHLSGTKPPLSGLF